MVGLLFFVFTIFVIVVVETYVHVTAKSPPKKKNGVRQ